MWAGRTLEVWVVLSVLRCSSGMFVEVTLDCPRRNENELILLDLAQIRFSVSRDSLKFYDHVHSSKHVPSIVLSPYESAGNPVKIKFSQMYIKFKESLSMDVVIAKSSFVFYTVKRYLCVLSSGHATTSSS